MRDPSACVLLTTSIGAAHLPPTCRETQMPTSGFFSLVPPNHAATSPFDVSTIVEAWQEGNGAVS